MDSEKRDRLCLGLRKLTFAKAGQGSEARGGTLINTSCNGAATEFATPLQQVDNPFSNGDEVEIEIEGMSPIKGHVSRVLEKGVAVSFSNDSKAEDQIIAEIMEIFRKSKVPKGLGARDGGHHGINAQVSDHRRSGTRHTTEIAKICFRLPGRRGGRRDRPLP